MEPNSVVQWTFSTESRCERYLVIEFKGMMAGQPSEVAKQRGLYRMLGIQIAFWSNARPGGPR